MRLLIPLAVATLLAAPAHAYSIEDLIREGRAHHGRMMTAVRDMRLQQEATFHAKGAGTSGMRSTTSRKGDRWRTDATVSAGGMGSAGGQSFTATTLFDGKDLWSITMGMKTRLPAGAVPDQSSPAYWVEPAADARIVGEETVHGRACWVVQARAVPAGPAARIGGSPKTWIDKKKFVYVQSEIVTSGKTLRSVYSDFRKVGGDFEIPHVVEVFSNGQKTMTATIVKLETNTGLADDLFDPAKVGGGSLPGARRK